MTVAIILMICGAFWIVSSFLSKTKNVQSTIFYNVIPFITGVIAFRIALGMIGVINIPV